MGNKKWHVVANQSTIYPFSCVRLIHSDTLETLTPIGIQAVTGVLHSCMMCHSSA